MEINGKTRTCGLIGNPVEHTMSPVIHNTLSDRLGQNIRYVPFHVNDGLLGDAVRGAFALNLLGLNVTVPYKSEVIPFLCEIDPLAERIGAVNTLVRTGKGYKGYNTDMPGLYRAMREDGIDIEGEEVIILGAGGVARAVAMLLLEKGAKSIVILNRNRDRAKQIAEEINRLASRDLAQALGLADYGMLSGKKYLVIQATSVGMSPDTECSPIEEEDFYDLVHTGYDLIFNPMETKFMRLVKAHGGRAFCGYKMLLYQGIIAYELWTGLKVDEVLSAQVYKKMLDCASNSGRNLILIGFMGSGKTSVGRLLSQKIQVPLEDTDALIEGREQCSISEIFRTKGETYFRDRETELLTEIAKGISADHVETNATGETDATCKKDTRDITDITEKLKIKKIISVGGGTPVREQNRPLIKKCGTVVYLRIRPETVYERLKGDTTRPLLACSDPMQRIREMLESRREAYEESADIIIDVDGMGIDEICDCLIRRLEEKKHW